MATFKADHLQLYELMLLIRRFEERLLAEFSTGRLTGTTHTCIGQEADAAGIFTVIDPQDVVFSNHRCHGHFLAYGGDPRALFAEVMGRRTGLVGGRGGSQHIHWRNFYSNGIQGGITPVAGGMALAEKLQKTGRIVLAFIGDGTLGQGVLYETLNLASLWSVPLLIVLEDNRIAQTTPVQLAVAGSMADRFQAFGIRTWELDSADVLVVQQAAREAAGHVRSGNPAGLILHTHRFKAHSKGDDTRSAAQLAALLDHDPLAIQAARLQPGQAEAAEKRVADRLEQAFIQAQADPDPLAESLADGSLA